MSILNNKKGILSLPNPAILSFKSRCLIRKLNLGLGEKFKVNKDETPGTILYSLKHRVPPDESDKKFFKPSEDIFINHNYKLNQKKYAENLKLRFEKKVNPQDKSKPIDRNLIGEVKEFHDYKKQLKKEKIIIRFQARKNRRTKKVTVANESEN